jgi:hypothetical protein
VAASQAEREVLTPNGLAGFRAVEQCQSLSGPDGEDMAGGGGARTLRRKHTSGTWAERQGRILI